MGPSAPVGGPLKGGEAIPPNKLSDVDVLFAPAIMEGKWTRLPVGLAKLLSCVVGGSISSVDKKDVPSSSGLALVMVMKVSNKLFCSIRGVPFRSRIFDGILLI